MSIAPLYQSAGSLKTIWQDYRIFPDRLEFETLLCTWSIPFEEIESVEVKEAVLQALVNGRLTLADFPIALKLDLADITEHVTVTRREGLFRRVLFSPEDPAEFVHVARGAIAEWQRRSESAGNSSGE